MTFFLHEFFSLLFCVHEFFSAILPCIIYIYLFCSETQDTRNTLSSLVISTTYYLDWTPQEVVVQTDCPLVFSRNVPLSLLRHFPDCLTSPSQQEGHRTNRRSTDCTNWKEGRQRSCQQIQPISLLCVFFLKSSMCVQQRIIDHLNDYLSDSQRDFLNGRNNHIIALLPPLDRKKHWINSLGLLGSI